MLVLSRHIDEAIVVGDDVEIVVEPAQIAERQDSQ